MSKEILSTNGEKLGEITLEKSVFGVEPNIHVMHLALRRQLNNARQGSACAKTRAEVAGGGRKPWKQKGTGRARAGSLRSPLFAGGGVSFGPKPRSYSFNMPQKARQLALKSALSAREAQLVVVKDFSTIAEPKTKLMVSALKALNVSGKVLVVADTKAEENKNLELSARNIPSVKLLLPSNLNVKDLLEADFVVMTESAVNEITEKSVAATENAQYTFEVKKDATKIEIAKAVELAFPGRKVTKVRTVYMPSHEKRMGYKFGRTDSSKKAIVTIEGEPLEFIGV